MISKLKIESGFNTISKLSRMFTDMDLSKGTMEDFQKRSKGSEFKGVELTVDILTSGIWPEQTAHPCKLPATLNFCQQKFEQFYKGKHSGRNLNWIYTFSKATMAAKFAKTYTLITSCYSCAILMLFNENASLTVREIEEFTGLPKNVCHREIKVLCIKKLKLLVRSGKAKELAPEENITVNPKFISKVLRVNCIIKPSKKAAAKGGPKTNAAADPDLKRERDAVMDAMIVRIMKARKKENHQSLSVEVMRQIFLFKPQPSMIKESIERLIEGEYVKRDDDNRNVYIYIP